MFFKIVVKIFENFTGKHLCWSLLLINFITNRLQHRFLLVKIIIFIIEHPRWRLLYSARTSSILTLRILIRVLEDSMYLQLFYFLNTISFWFVECLFLIDGTLKLANYLKSVTGFTLRFLYRLNQPSWKIHGSA